MKIIKIILGALIIMAFPSDIYSKSQQDPVTLSGVILSETQEPIPGAVIKHTESDKYTLTGFDGDFELTLSAQSGHIEISYLGYKKLKLAFDGTKTDYTIELTPDITALDEILVVGYGTQKKENMTGAVDQVDSEIFENRPITNIAQGLQGAIANLNLTPADGKPTQSAAFNIRGATSIGQGGNALVLIDGVEGDPALLNPNDIATVSVLKDASSAAIYGARAAFGVVLITTKTAGKERMQIKYSRNYSLKSPTVIPDYVTDGYTWASMFNEAFSSWNNYASTPQNVNKTMRFSQQYLEELKRRSMDPDAPKIEIDPATGEYVYYYSTNWQDELYKGSTHSLDQNISISQGSEKSEFYLTGQSLSQPGLFKYNSDDYQMYNFRAKGSVELLPWLRVGNNASFSKVKYHNPMNVGEAGGIWRNMVAEGHPMAPMLNPDGTLTHSAAYTVGDYFYGKNGYDKESKVFRNTTNFETNFFNNSLSIKGDFTYQLTNRDETRKRVPVPYSRTPGVIQYLGSAYNDYRVIQQETEYISTNLYGEYVTKINDAHNFKILGGFNYELNTFKRLGSQRNGLLYEDANDLNLAVGESILTSGGYEQWAVAGGFFRFNYDYKNRYLLEVNGRYDGSSKFPKNQRYAFFPSISAGWNISSEPFWNISKDLITYLKVRASYGSLGNGNISSYMFQEQLVVNRSNRILNGDLPMTTSDPTVIPDGLTWETVTTKNIGIDLAMLKNKLNISADVFNRKTTDMFTLGPELPAIFGARPPRGNYADLETVGWELSVAWRNSFALATKPFNYSIKANVADNQTTILKYNNPNKRLNDYYVGQKLGEIWGLTTDGFFLSEQDIRTSADQSLFSSTAAGIWRPGDIKFKDLNNDGAINHGENTATNPGDRRIIGNSSPRYMFGLNLGADWNNIFFNAFFQGVGKRDWYPSRGANAFWGQYNAPYGHPLESQIGNIWSPENPDAYFPRYTGYLAWASGGTLREKQTRYLQNAAYVRLKNIQIGYNLPEDVSKMIGANQVQLYVSGENLWTYSPMYKNTKGIDVENIGASDQDLGNSNYGDAFNYPILKNISVGASITF
ncbi:SusC/RagA family TonB-linked outer membrane protein [Gelidibacter maritimus]|uniref:TonB-dependent receptor n=1 Tax=Gelidibacter maritimus TaxID=2761487 RepID=A0A7W2M5I9_9FLAO|nr:TonB-dependent receptor [Gelidibacter maritimus]MBA6153112.1 TonB-dependent receptor [Gelidibacter maritimus]